MVKSIYKQLLKAKSIYLLGLFLLVLRLFFFEFSNNNKFNFEKLIVIFTSTTLISGFFDFRNWEKNLSEKQVFKRSSKKFIFESIYLEFYLYIIPSMLLTVFYLYIGSKYYELLACFFYTLFYCIASTSLGNITKILFPGKYEISDISLNIVAYFLAFLTVQLEGGVYVIIFIFTLKYLIQILFYLKLLKLSYYFYKINLKYFFNFFFQSRHNLISSIVKTIRMRLDSFVVLTVLGGSAFINYKILNEYISASNSIASPLISQKNNFYFKNRRSNKNRIKYLSLEASFIAIISSSIVLLISLALSLLHIKNSETSLYVLFALSFISAFLTFFGLISRVHIIKTQNLILSNIISIIFTLALYTIIFYFKPNYIWVALIVTCYGFFSVFPLIINKFKVATIV